MPRPSVHPALRAVALALAYVALARFGLALKPVAGFATLVWPPTGLALVALALWGYRYAPAIAAGAFVANASIGASLPVAAGIALGNTLEALLGCWLLRRADFRTALPRVRDVLALIGLGAIVSTAASALFGTSVLAVADLLGTAGFWRTFGAWWVGDAMGNLTFAPLLFLLPTAAPFVRSWSRGRWTEALLCLALTFVVVRLTFNAPPLLQEAPFRYVFRPFLLFPLMVWAALRFERLGAAVALCTALLVAVLSVAADHGPLRSESLLANLLYMQAFLFVVAVTGLTLAATVTEREAALRANRDHAEAASHAKSRFLANMSHEIRTPLNAIVGYAELLRDEDVWARDRGPYLETVVRNGQSLAQLIDDILDLSKVEAGHLKVLTEPVAIRPLLDDVRASLASQAQQKGVALRCHVDPSVPDGVTTDPTRLRQILVNVVGNAVKFTRIGHVEIRAAYDQATSTLAFDIVDTGPGVAAEHQARIFEAFSQGDASVTRRFGGTGLGLALSRRLARLLGGDVRLSASAIDVGSTFRVEVVAAPASVAPAATAPGDAVSLQGARVLVAEDSPDSAYLIRRVLARQGASVDVVENGKDAVRLASNGRYDLILMDIQMPEMDGYTAAKTLRNRGYADPIVALSAHAMKEERERARTAGFDGHLPKPIHPASLVAAASRFVHEASART